jgi:hypothetical protein
VLTRVHAGTPDALTAARRWTGLEPTALVPFRRAVLRANRRGERPDVGLLKSLRGVLP